MVYRDKVVPIPNTKGITINRADNNRVLFVKEAPYDAKLKYARPKRITIGYVTDNDTKSMNPTDGYKIVYPQKWEELFGEKVAACFKYIGMYALADAVNSKIGIKDIMDECFGIQTGNAMMDFVMYSMLFQTNVTEHFPTRMKDQQLFSGDCLSDSYYSDLYNNKISYAQILDFKRKWTLQCKEDGVENVWLCIDGSNDDCESEGVIFAEKGHAKSLRNRKIVSFTYAVTEEGKPVTFDVYRGGLVDAKALRRILSCLNQIGIHVKGVILDRGYCDATALRFLKSEKLAYVIMVKGTPAGYKKLVKDFGNKIKLNAEYLIKGTNLFGVQDQVQLFDNYDHKDHLTLFYDYKNGGDRITALLKKLNAEINRCEKAIARGDVPEIVPSFKDVLEISKDNKVVIVTSKLQEILDEKGLYSIVASEPMPAQQVHKLYQCRNCSETDYMIFKTQLGYGKVRVHVSKSVQSRFTIGFIASCVRFEVQNAAIRLSKSTTEVIQEMSGIYMTKLGDSYVPVQGLIGKQEYILKSLDSTTALLEEIAKDENNRIAGRKPIPRHRKPGPNQKKAVVLDPSDTEVKKVIKKNKSAKTGSKPGVKVGTHRPPVNKDGSPRKAPGVPKGTKRGSYNKDGSPRQKPGPKPKVETNDTRADT